MNTEFDYDLFVIGGGSGGVRGSRIAAGHGAKVSSPSRFGTQDLTFFLPLTLP